MGFISGLLSATLGGGGRRIFTGAIAGGIYGGASSDANTSTGRFRDIVAGAGLGAAGAGLLTTRTGLKTLATGGLGGIVGGGYAGWKAAKAGWGIAKGIGSMALKRPTLTAGLALGGLGAYSLAQPRLKQTADLRSLENYAQRVGTSTGIISHQQFQNSTYGLVQGLHRGSRS